MKHLAKHLATYSRLLRVVLLSVLVGTLAPALAQTAHTKPGLALQVSDGGSLKWIMALGNAKNAQNELGANNVDIEIVAYGPGVEMLRFETTLGDRIAEALRTGIKIVACESTMKSLNLTHDDMYPNIGYVSAGVIELMKRQAQGWAYIRP
jgi:intracellular sulfur oxidation DsrE/DsrF family protein